MLRNKIKRYIGEEHPHLFEVLKCIDEMLGNTCYPTGLHIGTSKHPSY